jgi:hypothetical protein
MPQGSFSAQINDWVAATKARQEAVFKEATQRVVEAMQEPGPSKASTKKALAIGAGLGKVRKNGTRGNSVKAYGPVYSGGSGNLPVDTGFLRASLIANLGQPNFALQDKPENRDSFTYDEGRVALVISSATIKDKITAAYSAKYARAVEYGSHGRPGRRFVALAAQRWPQIVAEVAAEAQARAMK